MEFNRRTFLTGLIGGASLATLGGAAFAAAPDRYKQLIALQRDLLADKELFDAKLAAITGPEPQFSPRPHNGTAADCDAAYAEWRATDGYRTEWVSRRREAMNFTLKSDYADFKGIINTKADYLLGWTMQNFNGSDPQKPEVRQQIKDLFNGNLKIDTLSESDLRSVEDAVVCIALAKNMLSIHKLPLDTQKMPTFITFCERFKELILC